MPRTLTLLTVLTAQVTITDLNDPSNVKHLGPGDGLALPKGCSVRWQITETCRKFFTIAP